MQRDGWFAEEFRNMDVLQYYNAQVNLTQQCDLAPERVTNDERVTCLENLPWYASGGIHGGLYVLHLKNWLKFFKREQFLLVPLSAYKISPVATLETIAHMLGFNPDTLDKEAVGVLKNEATSRSEPTAMETEVKQKLWDFFGPYNDELYKFVTAEKIPRIFGGTDGPIVEGGIDGGLF
jgi:hypothetical protein